MKRKARVSEPSSYAPRRFQQREDPGSPAPPQTRGDPLALRAHVSQKRDLGATTCARAWVDISRHGGSPAAPRRGEEPAGLTQQQFRAGIGARLGVALSTDEVTGLIGHGGNVGFRDFTKLCGRDPEGTLLQKSEPPVVSGRRRPEPGTPGTGAPRGPLPNWDADPAPGRYVRSRSAGCARRASYIQTAAGGMGQLGRDPDRWQTTTQRAYSPVGRSSATPTGFGHLMQRRDDSARRRRRGAQQSNAESCGNPITHQAL